MTFCCDYQTCKGRCCVNGIGGAPITEEEDEKIKENLDNILPSLSQENKDAIDAKGLSYIYKDNLSLILNDKNNCVFTQCGQDGIYRCLLQDLYDKNITPYLKPISCHMFPVTFENNRVSVSKYLKESVCTNAKAFGSQKGIRLYEFVKDALIRKFGQDWYDKLAEVADQWIQAYDS